MVLGNGGGTVEILHAESWARGILHAESWARGILHAESGEWGSLDLYLGFLIALSAVGALVVFALAAAAYRRRRSTPYLLITAALGALVLRPVVGAGTVLGVVPMATHHFVEHLLDLVIAVLLLAAVYTVGPLERPPDSDAREDQP